MTATTENTAPVPAEPPGTLSPNCATANHPDVPDDWEYGHRACRRPGYRVDHIGWIPVDCTCACHAEGRPS